jgi:cell division septation protein DedD
VLSRATPEAADPQPIQPAAAPKAKAPAQPVPKTPPATSASANTGGASGYVCVLASTASRMEALKKFADLQQKFEVLKDHVPEVKEVDLSARGLGTMYRLVAGPPSSREAASGLCSNLRTSGLAGDPWVTTY